MIRFIRKLSTSPPQFPPSLLNLRVGKIIQCARHENAEKLYVSQIQISPEASENTSEATSTIQVCSGLVQYIPIDQMQNRSVVVLTNLKPSKMRGVKSEAMLLASESPENEVDLVSPPETALVGDKLHFDGFITETDPPRLKSKIWDDIQTHLKTTANGEAAYITESGEEHVLRVGTQAAKSRLNNAPIR